MARADRRNCSSPRTNAALEHLDTARAGLETVVATGADFGYWAGPDAVALADVLRVQGDVVAAQEHAQQALETSERVSSPSLFALSREVLGRLAIGRKELERSGRRCFMQRSRRGPNGTCRCGCRRRSTRSAELAAGFKSDEEAARLLGSAERARSDLGLVRWAPDESRFVALAGTLRTELGSDAFADAHAEGFALSLDEAIAWVRRARGSRRRPAAGWESLTPTELQVVELAAQGLTNPEIGQRMFISRGTVKIHLSHIYTKLDVRNRSQLTALVTSRRPTPAP